MLSNIILEIEKYIEDYNLASDEDRDSHRYRVFSSWDFQPSDLDPLSGKLSSVPTFLQTKIKELVKAIELDSSALSLTSPYPYVRDCKVFLCARNQILTKER